MSIIDKAKTMIPYLMGSNSLIIKMFRKKIIINVKELNKIDDERYLKSFCFNFL